MRASLGAVLVMAGVLAGAVAWATTGEQTIVPLTPPVEQQVQGFGPGADQRVEAIGGGEQQVGAHVPPTEAQKTASNVGKAVLGVTGAVIALGAMAASLLLL